MRLPGQSQLGAPRPSFFQEGIDRRRALFQLRSQRGREEFARRRAGRRGEPDPELEPITIDRGPRGPRTFEREDIPKTRSTISRLNDPDFQPAPPAPIPGRQIQLSGIETGRTTPRRRITALTGGAAPGGGDPLRGLL